ncbi:MAG TPA: hypothetical protein ENG03_03675 [Thioploca sp.]|nr:hypothetical protein [Thioploca sp.]
MNRFYLISLVFSLVFLLPVIASAQEEWSISVLPKSEVTWREQRSNQFDILTEQARFAKFEGRVGMELGLQYQRTVTISWLGYTTKNEWDAKNYGRFREAYLGHEWSEIGLEEFRATHYTPRYWLCCASKQSSGRWRTTQRSGRSLGRSTGQ